MCMQDANLIMSRFGNRVRWLRIRIGLSQEQLAELAGLDRTYISSLERGRRNVGVVNCARIAKGLNVDLKDLFVETDESPL